MIADRSKCLYCDSDKITVKDNEYGNEYRCEACRKLSTDLSFDLATEIATIYSRIDKGLPIDFDGYGKISKITLSYKINKIIRMLR